MFVTVLDLVHLYFYLFHHAFLMLSSTSNDALILFFLLLLLLHLLPLHFLLHPLLIPLPFPLSISFTSPSHPLSFLYHPLRVPILEVTPHGNAYLRLWFNSSAASSLAALEGIGEVFLFLNDEAGQSEESFLFTVRQKI